MKIVNTIAINAPRQIVFSWLDDKDRAKRWMQGISRSETIRETPERVGTTFRECLEEDGHEIEMEGVVTDFVQDELLSVHLESKVHTADVTFALEERDGVTLLRQDVALQFKGVLRVLDLLMHARIKRKITSQTRSEFQALKRLCEQID